MAKNTFETADGTKAELKGNFLTGATLTVGENQVRIVNPVKWYEIVMSVLPFILIMIWGNSTALCKIVPVIGGAHRRRNFRITQRDERRNYQKSGQAVA